MISEKVFDLLERWQDLRQEGRQVAVEELCRECPELAGNVARLVRALEATEWLEERADSVGGVSHSLTSPEELGLPGKVGRYELRELIGEGGFGYVFKGYDPELRRPVAVKVARPSRTASPEWTERFLEEARHAARLKHPGIVPVHDVGRDGRWLYIVSDLVEGCDLRTTMAQRRLPAAESARIVARVADALHYAHRQGVIHRDVKPANILLDRDGNVFLGDFGIAATREQLEHGAVASEGTLAYMAPEQIAAVAGQVGPRSDVYSLGVVLYELLTEQRPARRVGCNPPSDPGKPLAKPDTVPPPSAVAPEAPPGLDAVCRRAISEVPTQRYGSAAEFAAAIRGAIALKSHRRLLPALATIAVAVLAIGAGMFAWQTGWQRQPGTPPNEEDKPIISVNPPPVVGATLFAGRYYKYIREKVTWHEAQRRCEVLGGTLAMIKTPQEQEFLAELLGREPAYVFIGLTDEGHEDEWRWVDGSRAEYTNWAKGEPNHFGAVEHWVAVNPSAGSVWGDNTVGHFRVGGFVCQWGSDTPKQPHRPPPPAAVQSDQYRPGLVAEFFGDTGFRQRVAARIDPSIDFDWGQSAPHFGVPPDCFAVRWRGYLKPPKAGRYTIVVRSCNGARVVLDGAVINEELAPERPWCFISEVDLTSGYHPFQIEFVHGAGAAHCWVKWGWEKGLREETIGPECFFHVAIQEAAAGVKPRRKE